MYQCLLLKKLWLYCIQTSAFFHLSKKQVIRAYNIHFGDFDRTTHKLGSWQAFLTSTKASVKNKAIQNISCQSVKTTNESLKPFKFSNPWHFEDTFFHSVSMWRWGKRSFSAIYLLDSWSAEGDVSESGFWGSSVDPSEAIAGKSVQRDVWVLEGSLRSGAWRKKNVWIRLQKGSDVGLYTRHVAQMC